MANVREVLSRLLAVPGVRAAVLVGREGLLIEAAGRGDAHVFEALGALGASALSTAEALGQEISPGATVGTLLEYERALVSADALGEYAAVVTLAENAASLGRIRQTLRASRDDFLRALDAR
jgi:predicted regulator of Ras-like GTPase activity (Roadblock/LC7/MglB family)